MHPNSIPDSKKLEFSRTLLLGEEMAEDLGESRRGIHMTL